MARANAQPSRAAEVNRAPTATRSRAHGGTLSGVQHDVMAQLDAVLARGASPCRVPAGPVCSSLRLSLLRSMPKAPCSLGQLLPRLLEHSGDVIDRVPLCCSTMRIVEHSWI